MDAVDGLLEFIIGPGVGHQDNIPAEVERVEFGHAFDAGQHDRIVGEAGTFLELGGEAGALGLRATAVEGEVGDAGFPEAGAEGVERVLERGEDNDLLVSFEDTVHKAEGGIELGGVAMLGAIL